MGIEGESMPCWKRLFSGFRFLKETAGFSLAEILVAITLMGLFGTFAIGKVLENLREGQINSAKIQMNTFKNLLLDYKRKCNRYPSTEQGLEALVERPSTGKECKNYPRAGFAEEIPIDPWDESYVYESDGQRFTIVSYGPDNDPETEDDISYPETKKN